MLQPAVYIPMSHLIPEPNRTTWELLTAVLLATARDVHDAEQVREALDDCEIAFSCDRTWEYRRLLEAAIRSPVILIDDTAAGDVPA